MRLEEFGLSAQVNMIGPQAAHSWLKKSGKNRAISQSRVARYAQAIELGEWQIAEPLMVNCDGGLINGHHRLHAVIESGQSALFVVIKGYDRDKTFGVVDEVQPRRLQHWLQLRSEPSPAVLAAVITMAAKDAAGMIPTGGSPGFTLTPIEGMAFLDEHPELRQVVHDAPGQVSRLAPRSVLCFCYWKFCTKDPSLARQFLIDLTIGRQVRKGDPVMLLRSRLEKNRKAQTKMRSREVLALIIKAWNIERVGGEVYQLFWRSDGPQAQPFPEVE